MLMWFYGLLSLRDAKLGDPQTLRDHGKKLIKHIHPDKVCPCSRRPTHITLLGRSGEHRPAVADLHHTASLVRFDL